MVLKTLPGVWTTKYKNLS